MATDVTLGKILRESYVHHRTIFESKLGNRGKYYPGPKWDGGRDKFGRTHRSVWGELAEKLLKSGVKDLVDYVRFAFSKCNGSRAIFPNQLTSPRLIDEYISSGRVENEVHDLELGLSLQRLTFLRETVSLRAMTAAVTPWSQADVEKHVLCDEQLELSALFRFLTARRLGHSEVATIYQEAARRQFEEYPGGYSKTWDQLLEPVSR